jgi:FMN-dependent NADH-azoreductase
MTDTILRIDASARRTGSVTRDLADRVVARLAPRKVIHRDLAAEPVPQIDEGWVAASFTPAEARSADQRAALALSDSLLAEIEAADTLVIGLPIYNFGVPAALKAWVDQVARAGRSFRYTAEGPVGLLQGKRAVVVVASGGVEAGSGSDFATGYIRHVLGFIGIDAVEIVTADRIVADPDAARARADDRIARLAA